MAFLISSKSFASAKNSHALNHEHRTRSPQSSNQAVLPIPQECYEEIDQKNTIIKIDSQLEKEFSGVSNTDSLRYYFISNASAKVPSNLFDFYEHARILDNDKHIIDVEKVRDEFILPQMVWIKESCLPLIKKYQTPSAKKDSSLFFPTIATKRRNYCGKTYSGTGFCPNILSKNAESSYFYLPFKRSDEKMTSLYRSTYEQRLDTLFRASTGKSLSIKVKANYKHIILAIKGKREENKNPFIAEYVAQNLKGTYSKKEKEFKWTQKETGHLVGLFFHEIDSRDHTARSSILDPLNVLPEKFYTSHEKIQGNFSKDRIYDYQFNKHSQFVISLTQKVIKNHTMYLEDSWKYLLSNHPLENKGSKSIPSIDTIEKLYSDFKAQIKAYQEKNNNPPIESAEIINFFINELNQMTFTKGTLEKARWWALRGFLLSLACDGNHSMEDEIFQAQENQQDCRRLELYPIFNKINDEYKQNGTLNIKQRKGEESWKDIIFLASRMERLKFAQGLATSLQTTLKTLHVFDDHQEATLTYLIQEYLLTNEELKKGVVLVWLTPQKMTNAEKDKILTYQVHLLELIKEYLISINLTPELMIKNIYKSDTLHKTFFPNKELKKSVFIKDRSNLLNYILNQIKEKKYKENNVCPEGNVIFILENLFQTAKNSQEKRTLKTIKKYLPKKACSSYSSF
jgi:hypothetical protein